MPEHGTPPKRDRQQDSQIGEPARAASSSTRRRLTRRGVSLVECLILLALLGLGLIAGVRAIHQGISDAASTEAQAIAALTPVRGGGSDARPAPQAPESEPAPEPPPPEEEEEDDDGGFWGDVADFAIDLTPIGDIKTLLDPNASVFDKVLSGVSLVTSVIPGVGQAVKGASVAIKAVKAVDNASDAARTADNVGDVAKAGERTDDVAESADEVPLPAGGRRRQADEPEAEDCPGGVCRNGTCFVAGTPVHTEHGLRPIEDVQPGERVWSRDEATGEQALRHVMQTFVKPNRVLLRIDLDAGSGVREELRVTPPHPFWTKRGWVPAEALYLDDEVMLRSGAWAHVAEAQTLDEGATVYNFEVEQFHTYFVGEAGAWVHNQGSDPCPPGLVRGAAEARQPVPPGSLRDFRPPPGSSRSPGHARSSHGWPVNHPRILEVRNNPDKIYVGTNSNGNPVAIFYKDQDVVITELGDTQSVITAYGASAPRRPSPVQDKWKDDPNYHSVE